ncbi:MAG: DUF4332 domain-containing protein [Oscillospiraceae bacterium]|nr:DUF4332 domain-containing protein [Oscillospiraceae bacterium]
MAKLSYIEGIGETYQAKLNAVGIKTIAALLAAGTTKKGRAELAEKSGITETLILKWVNHADLMRIKGVGSEYSDLLEAAGVDTVPELSKRRPDNLTKKMIEVNAEKKLVRQVPSQKMVEKWVAQAKALPRILEY